MSQSSFNFGLVIVFSNFSVVIFLDVLQTEIFSAFKKKKELHRESSLSPYFCLRLTYLNFDPIPCTEFGLS